MDWGGGIGPQMAATLADLGKIQAQGTLEQGRIWGQGLSDLGQQIGQTIAQAPQRAALEQERQARAQELQLNALNIGMQLQANQRAIAGRNFLAQLYQQPEMFGTDGKPDYGKMSVAAAQNGFPDLQKDIDATATQSANLAKSADEARDRHIAFLRASDDHLAGLVNATQSPTQAFAAVSRAAANGEVDPTTAQQLLDHIHTDWTDQNFAQQKQQLFTASPQGQAIEAERLKESAKPLLPARGVTPWLPVPGKPGQYAPAAGGPTSALITPTDVEAAAADPTNPNHDLAVRMKANELTTKSLDDQYAAAQAAQDIPKMQQLLATKRALAAAGADPALRAAQIATEQERLARLRETPSPAQVQADKYEQEYRTLLANKVGGGRTGPMGVEDQKVDTAIHGLAALESFKDPKTGQYNIPTSQQTELAMTLARLMSPNGVVGEGTLNQINQRTAKGDWAGLATYLSGTPVAATPQAIAQMYRDSILRQGLTAERNREDYLKTLRGLAPTGLDAARRQQLDQSFLNLASVKRGDYYIGTTRYVNGKPYTVTSIDPNGKVQLQAQ